MSNRPSLNERWYLADDGSWKAIDGSGFVRVYGGVWCAFHISPCNIGYSLVGKYKRLRDAQRACEDWERFQKRYRRKLTFRKQSIRPYKVRNK